MKVLLSSCILSALVSTSLAATPQYKARTDITTGFGYLYGMVVADFNDDGKPDIAATDSGANKVYVYLNDGTGSFGTAKPNPISALPNTIAAGDFNEDGKQDLIVSVFSGSPLLLTGNGDGTFTQQSNATVPGCVTYAVADLNQDKHLDVVCGGNGSIATYSGDGHGNFQQVTGFDPGSGGLFTALASADFNKDGKLDFVAVSPVQTAGIRYYAGYGDATFASPLLLQNTTISAPGSIAAADFDGDKNTDLLVSSGFFTYIISGAGNGTFDLAGAIRLPLSSSSSITVPPGTITVVSPWVAAADLDGDGKTDVVTANTYTTILRLLINDGTGKFPLSLADFNHAIDAGTSQLNTADLNGDSLPDLILANNITQNISIFLSIKPKTSPLISLSSNATTQFVGSSLSLTSKVTGSDGTIPTGSVTLMEGTSTLGQQTLDATGQAVFALSSLSAGQHSITAVYAGDSNFNTVTSSTVSQAITDMQIASTTASQTISAGSTASYNLTVTPVAGLSGTATITCSQLPSLTTCNPTTVTLNGKPATATLTVKTTAPVRSQSTNSSYAFVLLPLFAICCVRQRRLLTPILGIALICTLGIFVTGCSSNNSSTSTGTTTPGTPSGSSTFTVTAAVTSGSQTLTRTTTATLVVQ